MKTLSLFTSGSRRRVQREFRIAQELLCWDSRSLGSVPVVVSGLFLLTVIYSDNECKKTLSDILENWFHLESKKNIWIKFKIWFRFSKSFEKLNSLKIKAVHQIETR